VTNQSQAHLCALSTAIAVVGAGKAARMAAGLAAALGEPRYRR
jgi:hypothetical protein